MYEAKTGAAQGLSSTDCPFGVERIAVEWPPHYLVRSSFFSAGRQTDCVMYLKILGTTAVDIRI